MSITAKAPPTTTDEASEVIAFSRRVQSSKPWSVFSLKTRPTREGYQVLFLTLFVLVGAILRDVNLLIILAGILISMFFLQWRLCFRTLVGLRVLRKVPSSVHARNPFTVELTLFNPRRWLPAWMVVMKDRIRQVKGSDQKSSNSISVVVPKLQVGESIKEYYDCTFERRGIYEFGPLEVSTVFPLALMRSANQAQMLDRCIVHPAQGEILPAWRDLFEARRFGADRARVQSGSTEGEFYGLRAYQVGDSPRWVHWRTSAKRNELVVRQFERQDNIQASLLLDLYAPKNARGQTSKDGPPNTSVDRIGNSEIEDTAIEFVASLANMLVGRGKGVLSVSIVGQSHFSAIRIQSRNQVVGLLDHLSVAKSSPEPDWEKGLEALATPLRASPTLLIVSTRPDQWSHRTPSQSKSQDLVFQRASIRWLDASHGDLDRFFRRAP